jgi:hypothetical protein
MDETTFRQTLASIDQKKLRRVTLSDQSARGSMTITLTNSELAFLRRLLRPYLDYYGTLAGSAKCSPANRARWDEVRALEQKLNGSAE